MKKYYHFKMNLTLLNIFAVVLFIISIFICYLYNVTILDLNIRPITLILMIFWLIFHELLHALGFLVTGNAKLKDIYIGAELEKGIFYCMCKKEISKSNILISLMFPLFFIGILTFVIGLIVHSGTLIFLSIINISGASGDILMFLDIIRMPKDIKYVDIDDTTGYTIISKHNLENKRYISSYITKMGKYSSLFKHKDNNRIKITKTSKIFIVILIILSIVLTIF